MNRRGMVLALSLGVVTLLATLGAAFLMRSVNEGGLSRRVADRQAAFYLAEAGVDRASINLRTPADLTDDVLTQALPTGSLTIDSPPISLGSLLWKVRTHGTSRGLERSVEAIFQLTPQSVFQYSLFGGQSVNVTGSAQTDSYDSRLGLYNDNPGPGYNKAQDGDVGTNSTMAGGIAVGGSIFIEGQLVVGPGVSDPTSVVTGYDPAFITGNPKVVSQDNPFPMPSVSVPAGLTCNDLTVSGQTTTTLSPTGGPLGNGTYCYRNLTLGGGSTFTATGAVTVYLTGQLTAQGNSTVGVPSTPKRMLFLMSPTSGAELQEGIVQGSTGFYGAVYGPDATFTIRGNAEVFGAIIANQVNVTGSAEIHYDEGLTDLTTISNVYQRQLIFWQDLN